MKFKYLLTALAALLTFSTAGHADLATSSASLSSTSMTGLPRRPSIIFIQFHGLARGDLSCYGQTNFMTPTLDRLATQGVRFTHYSGGENSPATTAMLLAGNDVGTTVAELNLPERLKQLGYHTGLMGEWGLAGKPWTQGFDDFAGFLDDDAGRNYYPDHLWRYAPDSIFNVKHTHMDTFIGQEMLYPNTNGKKGEYLPSLFVKTMLNFIRINQPDKGNHYKPYFLLVNFPAPRTAAIGADDFPVPTDAPFTGEPWPQAAKNRAALITRLDDGVARLLEELAKTGQTNNTALFFASSVAPEKFAEASMNFLLPPNDFNNVTNPVPPALPMIAYWPLRFPAGQVSAEPWTAASFAATAMELTYAKPATNFTGPSILPVLEGRPLRTKNP